MKQKDFLDSSKYLKKLLQCQQKGNLFNHLINKDENIIETITRLYLNDDFEKLFDSLYKQIIDYYFSEKIGLVTDEIIVSEYSGVEKDRAYHIILRTENYHYYLINGSISKEANYALHWFKSKINSNDQVDYCNYELTKFLLGDKKYVDIDDGECDGYSSSDLICVWQNDNFYYLVTEAAYDEKLNEEDEDDEVEDDDY
jgi:hypothetical protein